MKIEKNIIINQTLNEVRVAITENNRLAEFFIELPDRERYIGNIYLGKVNRIVSGINAAFVSIGLKQDAFLHFSDVDESLENTDLFDDEDADIDTFDEEDDQTAIALRKAKPSSKGSNKPITFSTKKSGDIQINIEPKQDVIVQVVREAYGNKGVKVTSKIALPGRYVVLLPFDNMIGVSRKINSYKEKKRLRTIARSVLPEGFGCIIRTVCEGKSEKELKKDWESLLLIWNDIEKKVKKSKSPALLYQDMQLAESVIRDLFNSDISKLVVDSKKVYKEIVSYLKKKSPAMIDKLEYYSGKKQIFEEYGIEKELESTYKRKVGLHSGGSLVFDQTEAMYVIDVNSGRTNEKEQERNALKTNIEAAKEIARQIRLRDIGGMIIIDFIDMTEDKNRKKIYNEIRREFSKDRAKTVVYPVTQLGLIQITRQRVNQNIAEKTSETCNMCNGTGRVTSKAVLINSIERWLKNFRSKSREFRLILQVHPVIAEYITDGRISAMSKMMLKYFVKIKVQQSQHIKIDSFKFLSVRHQKDITNEFIIK